MPTSRFSAPPLTHLLAPSHQLPPSPAPRFLSTYRRLCGEGSAAEEEEEGPFVFIKSSFAGDLIPAAVLFAAGEGC